MRVSILTLAMLMPMVGAHANWEVEDASDVQGELFVAFAVDETDTIEVQISCDALLDYDLQFSIFTGIGVDQKKALPEPVSVSLTLGTTRYDDIGGSVTEVEDEKVIDISASAFPQIREMAGAVAKGKDFSLAYGDMVWTVPGTGGAGAMPMIFEHCPGE